MSDVTTVVAPGQEVVAWVLSKDDGETKRLSLSLKDPDARQERGQAGEEGEAGGYTARGGNAAAKVARSARSSGGGESRPAGKQLTVGKKGDWVQGKVKTVLAFGALVEVEEGVDGLLHVSEMSGAFACKGGLLRLWPSHASPAGDTFTDMLMRLQTTRMQSRRASLRRGTPCASASTRLSATPRPAARRSASA